MNHVRFLARCLPNGSDIDLRWDIGGVRKSSIFIHAYRAGVKSLIRPNLSDISKILRSLLLPQEMPGKEVFLSVRAQEAARRNLEDPIGKRFAENVGVVKELGANYLNEP